MRFPPQKIPFKGKSRIFIKTVSAKQTIFNMSLIRSAISKNKFAFTTCFAQMVIIVKKKWFEN